MAHNLFYSIHPTLKPYPNQDDAPITIVADGIGLKEPAMVWWQMAEG